MRQHLDQPAPLPAEDEDVSEGSRLVERWRQGDADREETFRQLYALYYSKVYRFFVRRGFPVDDSMDLAQETFLRVHKNLEAFRGDKRFEAWLFKIAVNLFRNRLRTLSTIKRDAQEIPLDDAAESQMAVSDEGASGCGPAGPLCEVLSGERGKLLREAMDGLPPQMRRCVLLRVDRDLKYREIAELLQVSIETVKAHLFQARQQLKGRLADYFTDLGV